MLDIDKTWHLAEDAKESELSDFELQLWRVFYGFLRWQEQCEVCANGDDMTAYELAILHIIRMQDRPKNIPELCRLMNREDSLNVGYVIKKLIKLGLIERKKVKTNTVYQITEEGVHNTERYKNIRKNVLLKLFLKQKELQLPEMTEQLAILKGLYEEGTRITASYKSYSKK